MIVVKKIKHLWLFIVLLNLSLVANLAIKVIPFRKLMRILTNSDKETAGILNSRERHRLRMVNTYLYKIEQKVPWRVKCFEQSIVVLVVCRIIKLNATVFFGIKKEDDDLKAHAWTMVGEVGASGVRNAHEYNIVYKRGLEMNG